MQGLFRLCSVNDVEEFYAKLQQITGANVKGCMVSSNGFQEGAINFARAKGIGLIRLLDNSDFKWILARAPTSFISHDDVNQTQTNIYQALVDEDFTSDNIDFFANVGDIFTHSAWKFIELISHEAMQEAALDPILNISPAEESHVPFIPLELIENKAKVILEGAGYEHAEFDIEAYCERLQSFTDLTIEYVNVLGRDSLGFDILGKISFDPTIIQVSRAAHSNILSRKFTMAHELGHYHLDHQRFLTSEFYADEDFERDVYQSVTVGDIRRMEWQANHFASCLLLPRATFMSEFEELLTAHDVTDRGHGVLFVDDQVCNRNTFYIITNALRHTFRVSRKVIEIRLKDLQILRDARRLYRD